MILKKTFYIEKNLICFLLKIIKITGIVKKGPLVMGKPKDPKVSNKNVFHKSRKGFTIQCIEPMKNPVPKIQPLKNPSLIRSDFINIF